MRIKRRTWWLFVSLLLFLPPLALLMQATGDENFCGTWCPRMFFVYREGQSLREFLIGMARNWGGVLLVTGIVAVTLFRGRLWCSHVCPVGGAMELGSRAVPKGVKIDYRRFPAVPFRYGYLLVYLVAPAIGAGALTCSYCQFGTVPRVLGAAFVEADLAYFLRVGGALNLLLVALLGWFALGGRGYCNLLCPVGALDALANRVSQRWGKRVRVDAGKCTACGTCAQTCPNGAVEVEETAKIEGLSCTSCAACVEGCAEGALAYAKVPGRTPDDHAKG